MRDALRRNSFCANRACRGGACSESVHVTSAAACANAYDSSQNHAHHNHQRHHRCCRCARAVSANPRLWRVSWQSRVEAVGVNPPLCSCRCGAGFSFGDIDGWCDCPAAGETCKAQRMPGYTAFLGEDRPPPPVPSPPPRGLPPQPGFCARAATSRSRPVVIGVLGNSFAEGGHMQATHPLQLRPRSLYCPALLCLSLRCPALPCHILLRRRLAHAPLRTQVPCQRADECQRMRSLAWPAQLQAALQAEWGPHVVVASGAVRASSADFPTLCWDEVWGEQWAWGDRPRAPRLDLVIIDYLWTSDLSKLTQLHKLTTALGIPTIGMILCGWRCNLPR